MKTHDRTRVVDLLTIFRLRLKLIVRDKITLTVLIASILIFAVVIQALSSSADNYSAIPIGLIDYDNTVESKHFLDRVGMVPSFRIVGEEEKELHRLLLDEQLYAVFVIEEGFEKQIRRGNPKELISVYFKGKHRSSSVIADILAGEMMYPVTLYKSIRYYRGMELEGDKLTDEEYKEFMNSLLEDSTDFDFAFDITYEQPEGSVVMKGEMTGVVLYNQLILSVIGIVISFIAMFLMSAIVREKELGISSRLITTRFSQVSQDVGGLAFLLFVEGILGGVFTFLILHQLEFLEITYVISFFFLLLEYAFVMGCFFLLLSKGVRNIIAYQMGGSLLILLTGGMGMYQILGGFSSLISHDLLKNIPNSWFIQSFTDIMIYENNQGIFMKGHIMLAYQAVALFVLILIVNLLQEKAIIKRAKIVEVKQ